MKAHPTLVLADLGGDPSGAVQTATILMGVIAGGVFLFVFRRLLQDLFRFGRDGMPWLVAISISILCAGAACWLTGYVGAVAALPVLIAFGVGRRAACRRGHSE